MLASMIYYKVEGITDEQIDINNYMYRKVNVTLPKEVPMELFISERDMNKVVVGKYYMTRRAFLTSMNTSKNTTTSFNFRVDSFEEITKEIYYEQFETVVEFHARIHKRQWDSLKNTGPMLVPTFKTTVSVRNEYKDEFNVVLIGFYSKATLLRNISNICYADIKGTISKPKNSKYACAIISKEVKVKKEVSINA